MENTEKPRRILDLRFSFSLTFAILASFICFGTTVAYFAFGMNIDFAPVIPLVLACVFYIFIDFIFILPRREVKYHLFDDKLVVRGKFINSTIEFSKIKKVRFGMRGYNSNQINLHMDNGQVHSFNGHVERAEYILEAIWDFDNSLMDYDDYKKMRKALVLQDHFWARHTKSNISYFIMFIKFIAAPIGIGVLYDYQFGIGTQINATQASALFLFLFFEAMAVGFLLTFICEKFLNERMEKRITKQASSKIRDLELENRVHILSNIIFFILMPTIFYVIIR